MTHRGRSSPVVLVQKTYAFYRICIYFLQLNAKKVSETYTIPRISTYVDCLGTLNG